ncbi:hypothetical protein ORIO_23035 (plasmid) [Cereibacter azotoformans]|uniref:Uncharacterized protein n=1 Tax=Cereibacter sphaeroides (strain ATCC 17025 / ATH 2.4.3) TaxID=349102 RepID=A4X0N8_CERS5|nr:hypothetical protein [Cereibacter azotoformans]ULB12640.1 hypothetical protein ORIO_23035 [Cereibacter azotoformans]
MTDFDSEMMREDKPPLPLPATREPLREGPRVLPADPALMAAMAAARRPEPAPEPLPAREELRGPGTAGVRETAGDVRQAPQADRAPDARQAPQADHAPDAGRPAPEPDRSAEAEARRRRERMLTGALAGLLQGPEDAVLAPLIGAFEAAPASETALAADALVALYLRAEADLRRRLRPVLANLVRAAPASALGRALGARLGALAMPGAAPPPAPPPPAPPE